MFYLRNLCTGGIQILTTLSEVGTLLRRSISTSFIKKNIGRIFYSGNVPFRIGFSIEDVLGIGTISITSRHVVYTAYHDTGSRHEFIGTFKTRESLSRYIQISLAKTETVPNSGNRKYIAIGSHRSRYPRVTIEASLLNCNVDYQLDNQSRVKHKFADGVLYTRNIHTGNTMRFPCFRDALSWLGIAPTQVYRAIASEGIVNSHDGYLQCTNDAKFITPKIQRRLVKYQYRYSTDTTWSEAVSICELATAARCSVNYINALVVSLVNTKETISCVIKGCQLDIRLYQLPTTIPYTVITKKKELNHA